MRSSSSQRCSRTKAYDDGSARSSASTRSDGQQLPGLLHLPAPDQTLAGDALRALGHHDAVAGQRGVRLAEVGDRLAAQGARPGEGGESVAVRLGPTAVGDGLCGVPVGAGDLRHRDDRVVLGQLRQHLGTQARVVTGLDQRLRPGAADVVVVPHDTLHQQQVCGDPGGRIGQRVDRSGEQVGDALPLPRHERDADPGRAGAGRTSGSPGASAAAHVSRAELPGVARLALPPRPRQQRPAPPAARPRSGVAMARWRAWRCSLVTTSASARWRSRISPAVACRFAAAASRGCEARTRSPSATTTPSSSACSKPPGPVRSRSWSTRRSASRARASNTRRTTGSRSAMRRPTRSSTWSGTGTSSPRVSRSRPARTRPTSRVKNGLPRVVSNTRRSTWCGRRSPSRSASR